MSTVAIKTLTKEYIKLHKKPVEFVKAVRPLYANTHEYHFRVNNITLTL